MRRVGCHGNATPDRHDVTNDTSATPIPQYPFKNCLPVLHPIYKADSLQYVTQMPDKYIVSTLIAANLNHASTVFISQENQSSFIQIVYQSRKYNSSIHIS